MSTADPTPTAAQRARRSKDELIEEVERLEGRLRRQQADRERRIDDFARSMCGWFWEMDADLRFTFMSPSVERITGVPAEWHYGKTRAELGSPQSVSPERWQAHLEALERREPFDGFVFQRMAPDGAKWMQTSGVPLFDADGAFAGYRGVATEVTARVAAERRAERLTFAIDNISDLLVLWDADDQLVTCNQRFREINAPVIETTRPGTHFEEHIRAALEAGLYPEARGREDQWFAERLERHRKPGPPVPLERQDGCWILVGEHRLPDGSTLTLSTDITDQRRAELDLARQHGILDAALKTIPDGVEVLDSDLNMVACNNQLFRVTGLDAEQVLGADDPAEAMRRALDALDGVGAGEADGLLGTRARAARAGVPVEHERQLPTGKWLECRGNPIAGGGYLTVYRDIDESKRMREELEVLASTDSLTGVFNRRRFLELAREHLLAARGRGTPMSVLVIDVDHFKQLNDRHGHAAGDEALRLIAVAGRNSLRQPDIFGRLGGEEFAAVLVGAAGDVAVRVGERIRRALAMVRVPVGDDLLSVTASVGAAQGVPELESLEELLARADAALYEAKSRGRDRVVLHRGQSAPRRQMHLG